MLTFPGGAPISSVPQMSAAYGGVTVSSTPYGATVPATNAYGTPMYPSSGSYAM